MNKQYRNVIIVVVAACFSVAGFFSEPATAQSKTAPKPTATPTKKKSPAPAKAVSKTKPAATPQPKASAKPKTAAAPKTDKTAVKTKPATAPKDKSKQPSKPPIDSKSAASSKSANAEQIIVMAAASRIRQQPKADSAQLTLVPIGKTLPVSEKNAAWYRVEYASGKSGWISKTIVKNFETASRDEIFREIADKYSKNKNLDFASAAEVSDFLRTAPAFVKDDALKADLGVKRLRVLAAAMRAVPFGKAEQSPYKTFLRAHEKEVVYSEPSGQWLVRSDVFWELHAKYTALPAGEDIAWEAAQNPIPGECEGYVNCYLYLLRATDGEYLNFYPNGKYSKKALANITNLLDPLIADLKEKTVYTPPTDISDRAEFNRFLTELRTIISKMPSIEKNKPLQQINLLGEGYK